MSKVITVPYSVPTSVPLYTGPITKLTEESTRIIALPYNYSTSYKYTTGTGTGIIMNLQ